MDNTIKNIFKTIFLISSFTGSFIGLLLIYFSLYDTNNLIRTGKILYEIIFGPLYIGTYYMQRVPSYLMGVFFIIYAILSVLSITLLIKKNKFTRGIGMTCCTAGLVAILLSRPIRYEIFYSILVIWILQLSVLFLLWNKLLFEKEINEK